jgi:hypothetical protein
MTINQDHISGNGHCKTAILFELAQQEAIAIVCPGFMEIYRQMKKSLGYHQQNDFDVLSIKDEKKN